jgi:DNA-binding response OmpR family regulator
MASKLIDKNIKVVAIDSSGAVRQLLSDVIRSLGFENVQGVGSIKDLFSILEVEKIDWIISPVSSDQDINILHLLQTIIDFPELRQTRVTVILEETELDLIPSIVERGALGWLTKPFNKASLTTSLTQIITDLEKFGYDETKYSLQKYDEYLETKGRHEERIESIKSFMKINPGNPNFLVMLGRAYAGSGLKEQAKNSFRQSVVLDPSLLPSVTEAAKSLLGEDGFLTEKVGPGAANLLGIDSIVLIDDDTTFSELIQTALKEAGIPTVNTFSNGQAAWEWIEKQEKIDLVIQEWRIPGLTGPLLLQRVRHKFPMAPIVIATSVFEESDKPLLYEMGVAVTVAKPSTGSEVLNQIIYTIQQDRSPTDVDAIERKIRQSLSAKEFETAARLRSQLKDTPSIPQSRLKKIDAEFFFAENKFIEARDAGIIALKMSSDSIMLLSLLGKCFLKIGDYAASMKCFERAQMLSPMNIGRLCEIATVHSEAGKAEEAQTTLDQAAAQDKGAPSVMEATAKIAINSGDLSAAKEIMNQMDSLADVISYMNNRAVSLSKIGNHKDGIDLYKKTFDAVPDSRFEVRAIVKYNLALALIKQKNLIDAKTSLEETKSLGKTKVERKAISLLERVEKAIKNNEELKLKGNDNAPTIENGAPIETAVREENIAIVEAVEKKAGDLGCYRIVKDLKPHESIEKMLQKKPPRFVPRDSIKRAEALGVDRVKAS